MPARALTKALTANKLIEFHLAIDTNAPDHAQGALRLRASFDASAARRLGSWLGHRRRERRRHDRPCAQGHAARRRVVLSDYAKGALTPRVIRAVIDAANKLNKPVVVDPKGRDYRSIAARP